MWLVFTLVTTMIWGLAELFYKKGARPDEKYSHIKISIFVGLVMGVHALFVLITNHFEYDFINIIRYLPVSFLYILSMALSFFGMRFLEESISDPIENTSGVITAILCFLILKQTMSPLAIVAVLLITVGVVLIGLTEVKHDNGRMKKFGKKLAIISFVMPFLYAILYGAGSFLDTIYLEMETSPLIGVTEETIETVANTSYELTFFIIAIFLIVFLLIRKEKLGFKTQKDKMLAAVCETAGQFTYVYAMSGNAIIAAPIISSVCVVSLVLSRIFLKEKLTIKQYIAIALVIIGILLISITEES